MSAKWFQLVAAILLGIFIGKVAFAQRPTALTITRIFTGPDDLAHAERTEARFSVAPNQPTRGVLESHQVGTVNGNAVILRTSPDYFSEARFGSRGRHT
jgi:hypothetical protein